MPRAPIVKRSACTRRGAWRRLPAPRGHHRRRVAPAVPRRPNVALSHSVAFRLSSWGVSHTTPTLDRVPCADHEPSIGAVERQRFVVMRSRSRAFPCKHSSSTSAELNQTVMACGAAPIGTRCTSTSRPITRARRCRSGAITRRHRRHSVPSFRAHPRPVPPGGGHLATSSRTRVPDTSASARRPTPGPGHTTRGARRRR